MAIQNKIIFIGIILILITGTIIAIRFYPTSNKQVTQAQGLKSFFDLTH